LFYLTHFSHIGNSTVINSVMIHFSLCTFLSYRPKLYHLSIFWATWFWKK